VAGPGDVARNGGQVTGDGRLVFLLLVELLDLLELLAVVLEDDVELGVKVGLERLALKNVLELVEEVERVLNGGDVLERLVDELLEGSLQVGDANVELNVVAVELVVVVVEEVVLLAAELRLDLEELVDERLHAL